MFMSAAHGCALNISAFSTELLKIEDSISMSAAPPLTNLYKPIDEQLPGTWAQRVDARLAETMPKAWLWAIYQVGDDRLYEEAIWALEQYEWEPPEPPPTIMEGTTPHRLLYWAWLRAPNILKAAHTAYERNVFMFQGGPYTVSNGLDQNNPHSKK